MARHTAALAFSVLWAPHSGRPLALGKAAVARNIAQSRPRRAPLSLSRPRRSDIVVGAAKGFGAPRVKNVSVVTCPCGGPLYAECCGRLHTATSLADLSAFGAEEIMRARYAAFALGLPDFIILTTHPENIFFQADMSTWRRELKSYLKKVQYTALEVLNVTADAEEPVVHFRAHSSEGVLEEKSKFMRHDGAWLYKSGELKV
ncbi:UPF0225 protein [Porphyridium purpureum]|uniref:UPF0225 protein n=1 Tax=Porphyridium purpureum TaxID=35688 RepID=A0A5J4YJU5_PORPP|nr:UPF0225 protein [Porphyridium purpureum]|eukprot:POR5737..scf251_18